MAKSVAVAYLLWFFFGSLGLHQFYLRRDKHAFFTWATFGGIFGIGLMRDLFCIPKYTEAANQSIDYLEDLTDRMKRAERPSVSTSRFIANACLGYLFGMLLVLALYSQDMDRLYFNVVAVFAHLLAGIGVYYMANEGEHLVKFSWCSLGSLAPLPMTWLYGWQNIGYGAFVSAIAAWQKVEWKRTHQQDGACFRVCKLSLLGIFYAGLLLLAVFSNAYVKTKDGDSVPLRTAAKNFFKSPAWRETKEMVGQFYQFYRLHGFSRLWEEIVEALDPKGEINAYKVLGLNKSASPEDIKSSYKQLARRWHPDKVKDTDEKLIAEEKFIEIQSAYNILSNKKNRNSKSKL